jgi:hypothetical protein
MPFRSFYEEILMDECLDEETKARILEQLHDEREEYFRDKAVERARRLHALANLSLLNPDIAELPDGMEAKAIPPDEQLAPEQGDRLCETNDHLFLATILNRSRNSDYILQCGPVGTTTEWIYLPEREVTAIPEGYTIKQRRSPQEIIRLFKECFYGFRMALAAPERSDMSFSIGGIDVRHAGSHGDQPFWNLAARIHHPFFKGNDPLLEGLCSRHFFEFPETRATGSTPFLCPIDGPVAAVEAKMTTPGWTWRQLCGREWHIALCPKCLGEFGETGFLIN